MKSVGLAIVTAFAAVGALVLGRVLGSRLGGRSSPEGAEEPARDIQDAVEVVPPGRR